MKRESGQSLAELMVAVGVLGLFAAISFPSMDQARRRMTLLAATSELRATFHYARTLAIARDRNVALKFQETDGRWTWSVYEDGDADGVRNDDIHRGVDRRIAGPRRFEHEPARIGVPRKPLPDPFDAGQTLGMRSPVRFGASGLCSFSRAGEASNGSMVLTNGDTAAVVRVNGVSARITVMRWDGQRWKEGE